MHACNLYATKRGPLPFGARLQNTFIDRPSIQVGTATAQGMTYFVFSLLALASLSLLSKLVTHERTIQECHELQQYTIIPCM